MLIVNMLVSWHADWNYKSKGIDYLKRFFEKSLKNRATITMILGLY